MYWEEIEGYFNFQNIYTNAVNTYPNGSVFVEIGCYKGKSTVYMAEEIIKSKKQISWTTIDTFEGTKDEGHDESFLDIYLKNVEPVKGCINTIVGDSKEEYKNFEDKSIDFLFIDGDHTFKGCRKDIELWFPKIKRGANKTIR